MARTNRDDFSTSTKDKAAKRSAYRCAFCGKPTIGPSFENNEAVSNTGVAAHICAAASGGKRYDPIKTLLEYCSDDDLKTLAELLINNELEKKVICSSASEFHFECPKGKEELLNKYIICVAKQKGIYSLTNEKGERASLCFGDQYFQLVYSAFSLAGKIIHNDISFDSNPEDADYNYLTQRKKIIKQLNLDAQSFIWETLLQYVFLTPKEFNQLVSEIPVFIKEEFKIERTIWMFKVKNSIETINVDDLLDFSKRHHNYFVLVMLVCVM